MSKEKAGAGVRVGEYMLGLRYHEVGPGMGRLYEARHTSTGRPTLLLLPGEASRWALSEPWSVHLAYDPGAPVRPWRIPLLIGLMFLAFVGLGLALGLALRQVGGP